MKLLEINKLCFPDGGKYVGSYEFFKSNSTHYATVRANFERHVYKFIDGNRNSMMIVKEILESPKFFLTDKGCELHELLCQELNELTPVQEYLAL